MNRFRYADLRPGQTSQFSVTVTAAMLDTFAALTGDVSPIHVDQPAAHAAGFADRVAHGMLTAAFYSTLAGVHLPGATALLQAVEVSFLRPVFPGDVLTVSGEVAHMNDAFKQIEVKAQITNAAGDKVSRAKLKVGVRE